MNLFEKYSVEPQPQNTDLTHVLWMLDVLLAWPFERCLEIGTYCGASTTAFVEAINRGHKATFHTCDINWQPAAELVVNQAAGPIIAHRNVRSVDVLTSYGPVQAQSKPFDFLYIDGDHTLPAVQEELDALFGLPGNAPLAVFAHDTCCREEPYDFSGAHYLKHFFQTTPPYLCLEDNLSRPGQQTERGMFFATRDVALFEIARESLGKLI